MSVIVNSNRIACCCDFVQVAIFLPLDKNKMAAANRSDTQMKQKCKEMLNSKGTIDLIGKLRLQCQSRGTGSAGIKRIGRYIINCFNFH